MRNYPLKQIFEILEEQEPGGKNWEIKEEINFHATQILSLCDRLYEMGDRSMEEIAGIPD